LKEEEKKNYCTVVDPLLPLSLSPPVVS